MATKENFNAKLLVEGNDDQHVIWALCEKFGLSKTFDVIDCRGVDNLYKQIPVRFKQSDVNTVGIIIDADTELQSRWDSLKGILIAQGFEIPDMLPEQGLVTTNTENKKVGVWIMPDNNTNGMLEDFIAFLVPKDDELLPIVNSTLQSIEEQKLNKYSLSHKSKATIHSWLSWQKDPGTPMGLGITKKYLTTDEVTCKKLIDWMKTLFSRTEKMN